MPIYDPKSIFNSKDGSVYALLFSVNDRMRPHCLTILLSNEDKDLCIEDVTTGLAIGMNSKKD